MTAIGSSYTASYDAAGNMLCRAPASSTTCSGTQTGAQLSYNNEGRLSAWQNAPGSNPTSSTSDLYDGAGNRVAQQVTANGATTTTVYVGRVEEVSTTASNTTTTTYYYAVGTRLALAVNGVFSYLGSDGLGSANVALDANGNLQASALYGPYGATRYASGTMPGSYAFTGQRSDAATGLDYYNARYYDPVAQQFTSADTVADGLNRYSYVGGNPETATDPSGNCEVIDETISRCSSGSSSGSSGGRKSCRDDWKQDGCTDWLKWRTSALDTRTASLLLLDIAGWAVVFVGFAIEVGAMWGLERSTTDISVKSHAWKRILEATVLTAVPALMHLSQDLGWAWAATAADFLTSVYDAAKAFLRGMDALMAAAGWFFATAAGFLLSGLEKLAGGLPGFLGDIAVKLLSKLATRVAAAAAKYAEEFAADAVFSVGQGIQAAGWAVVGAHDAQMALPIWDWCSLNKACGTEPNHGMPKPGTP